MLPAGHSPKHNHLLAALPAEVFERISPQLELVAMPLGDALFESGGQLQSVYFPTTSIVSLHYILENGSSIEIAGVGNEGVLGISLFLGGNSMPGWALVQVGGCGYRLRKHLMMDEFKRAGPMMHWMLRYTQALISQVSQTAVCNRHHSIEQRLCRLLLSHLDRLHSNELTMTQELIAGILGVRREGITEVAGKLQRAGLISYQRGHITALNRAGLESHSCECYYTVREEFHHLFCGASHYQEPALARLV